MRPGVKFNTKSATPAGNPTRRFAFNSSPLYSSPSMNRSKTILQQLSSHLRVSTKTQDVSGYRNPCAETGEESIWAVRIPQAAQRVP
jgi:hypothetical protein